jgi:hypothetical protein
MCNFYKNASKLFYQFGKICFLGGGLAIFYGIFYLIYIFVVYEEYEIGNILSDFSVLLYIANAQKIEVYNENKKIGEFNPSKESSKKVLKDGLCDPMI